MMMENSASLVCSADVAAFVDALETINSRESTASCEVENVDSINQDSQETAMKLESVLEYDKQGAEDGHFFNPDTRRQKSTMQRLLAQNKAVLVKRHHAKAKTAKFTSSVWEWFGDIKLLISEREAELLEIPYYVQRDEEEPLLISKTLVGCFKCSAVFMYDSQRHSTSTLRYHVKSCMRPRECIFVSDDMVEVPNNENQDKTWKTGSYGKVYEVSPNVASSGKHAQIKQKRVRTDARKDKEIIEELFQKNRAVVTRKSSMNIKGNRRFKSNVWNWFGDVKLLISQSEAKKLRIPYYIRRCGNEQMLFSKIFVSCFECHALFIHDSQKSTSTLLYHVRSCSRNRKKRNAPNIVFLPKQEIQKQTHAISNSDVASVQEKLANFVLSTESSVDIISDPEFINILQMCVSIGSSYGDVNIRSLLCPTSTLANIPLNDLYTSSVNEFYTEFQHSFGSTYGVNIWIDETIKIPFLSMICNYITPDGTMKSVTVQTEEFDYETKTSEDLNMWFALFIADQPVVPFKHLVITDNESNLVEAFKDELCVKCAIQSLNIVLQNIIEKGEHVLNNELPDFLNLFQNCIDITEYFGQIVTECALSKELIKCQDNKLTSVIPFFHSINANYENMLSTLNERGDAHLLSFEKASITALITFFKMFEDAFSQLSNSTEPTLNLVLPCISDIIKHCMTETDDFNFVKQLKSHIAVVMNEYLTKNVTIYHRIATLLDPRYKKLIFLPHSEQVAANVMLKHLVKDCIESSKEQLLELRKTHRKSDEPTLFITENNYAEFEKSACREVEAFLAEPFQIATEDMEEENFSLLQYWLDNSKKFPNLRKVAHWILSCPASSIHSNEAFWSNNWLVNCCHMPLQTENINKILFIKTFRGI